MDARVIRFWTVAGVVGVAALFWAGNLHAPRSYSDVAGRATAHCLATEGDHKWRGSSGMTLEEYCKYDGLGKGLLQQCAERPGTC